MSNIFANSFQVLVHAPNGVELPLQTVGHKNIGELRIFIASLLGYPSTSIYNLIYFDLNKLDLVPLKDEKTMSDYNFPSQGVDIFLDFPLHVVAGVQ